MKHFKATVMNLVTCFLLGVTLICPGVTQVQAQGLGLIAPGHVIGNGSSANPGEATDYSLASVMDQSLGSTRGMIVERGAAGWTGIVPGTSGLPWVSNGGGSDPAYQTISGTAFANQTANTVFAGPSSGAAATPAFRSLVSADMPCTASGAFSVGTGSSSQCSTVAGSVATLNGGPLTITPVTNTWTQGLSVTQTGNTTSQAGPWNYNILNVTHNGPISGSGVDAFGNTNVAATGFRTNFTVAPGASAGNAVGGLFATRVTSTGAVGDIVSLAATIYSANTALGLTGGYLPFNAYGVIDSGSSLPAGGFFEGIEIDVGLLNTLSTSVGTTPRRIGLGIWNVGISQGSVLDTAIAVTNWNGTGTSGGAFKNFVVFSNFAVLTPFTTTATLFSFDHAATISNVFDFNTNAVTINGSVFKSPNLNITGAGTAAFGTNSVPGAPIILDATCASCGTVFLNAAQNTTSGLNGVNATTSTASSSYTLYVNEPSRTGTFLGINLADTVTLAANSVNGLLVGTSTSTGFALGTNNLTRILISSGGLITLGNGNTPSNTTVLISQNTAVASGSNGQGPSLLQLTAVDGAASQLTLNSFGTGAIQSSLIGTRAHGTAASPTTVAANDVLLTYGAYGYDGTNWDLGGAMQFVTTAAVGNTSISAGIKFLSVLANVTKVGWFTPQGGLMLQNIATYSSTNDPGAEGLYVNGVVNFATGLRIANAAASGHYLRGNGTNYVDSTIQSADLPGGSNSITIAIGTSVGLSLSGCAPVALGGTCTISATTDTVQWTALGLGGAAPSTGLRVYNAGVLPTGNGQAVVGGSNTNGGVFAGQGSTNDLVLNNKSGSTVCSIATGGTTINCATLTLTNPLAVAQGGTGLTSFGTGVATALGTNINTNGGLLTGTTNSVAAGSVVVGAGSGTAPTGVADVATGALLASGGVGANPSYCTACTVTTSITVPLDIGGTAAGSTKEIRSTSGTGSGDFVSITGGTNGGTTLAKLFGSADTLTLGNGNTPSNTVVLISQNTGVASGSNGQGPSLLQLTAADGNQTQLTINQFSTNTTGPIIVGTKARGTAASPSSIAAGDASLVFGGYSYDGTNWDLSGSIAFVDVAVVGNTSVSGMVDLRGVNANTLHHMWISKNSGLVIRDTASAATADALDPGAESIFINGQQFMPNITTSSAAQTGTVCWTTGTGKFTVDTTVGCLTSLEESKDILATLDPRDALRIVDDLRPFSFRYRQGWGDDGHYEQFGLGAHQVATVDERLVGRDPKGTLQGVRYMELTAVLVGAIRKLKADNDNLRAELNRLTAAR